MLGGPPEGGGPLSTGLLGAFIVAGFDEGAPSILYAEPAVEGQTIEKSALVGKTALAIDRLRLTFAAGDWPAFTAGIKAGGLDQP